MQVGGGDQWGNITSGCEFVRKKTGDIVHGKLSMIRGLFLYFYITPQV